MRVAALYRYPVKSFDCVPLQTMQVDAFGPVWDRRFMLVDEDNRFITQRKYPTLRFLKADIEGDELRLAGKALKTAFIPLGSFSESCTVQVWGDEVDALVSSDHQMNLALSSYVGFPVRLVYMPSSSFRQVDLTFSQPGEGVGFADGFPFLLTNTASLADLNGRLESEISMLRFRPNIVIDGALPYQEDTWRRIRIGEITFVVSKPCSRCAMTTIDDRGQFGKEPLKTLATYRRNEYGVCFGQNLVHEGQGEIAVGDEVEVIV